MPVGVVDRPGILSLWVEGSGTASSSGEGAGGNPPRGSADLSSVGASSGAGIRPIPARRTRIYLAVGVAIVAVAIVMTFVLVGTLHASGSGAASSDKVLEPAGSLYSLPYSQFAATPFITNSTGNVTGTFMTTNTISVFLMNDTQFRTLVRTAEVPGYEWTLGPVWNGSFSVTVTPGSWVFLFDNLNRYGSSEVLITTQVVFTPS
jgi:hypothetical protein